MTARDDAPAPVLAATVARLLGPGANRAGRASETPWVVLLPEPTVGEAWVVGHPSAAELAGLALVADRIRIIGSPERGGDPPAALERELAVRDADPARVSALGRTGDATPGLLWLRRDARLDRSSLEALARQTVGGGGVVVAERREPPSGLPWRRLRVGPLVGPIRTAFPAGDAAAAAIADRWHLEESAARRWLARRGIPRPRPVLRPIVAAERVIAGRRDRAVAMAGPGLDVAQPPAWLRRLGAAASMDLGGHAWVLAARGDYATQKVLLVLEPRAGTGGRGAPTGQPGDRNAGPTLVAKIALDPIAVPRVQAAAVALGHLATLPAAADRVPAVRLAERAGPLGVIVETAVTGQAFEGLDPARAGEAAADLVDWLERIALESAHPVRAGELRSALGRIVDAYATAYAPTPAERRAIGARVDALATADPPLRSVFLHGDPGVQNLVVDAAGRVIVLDWENGDPAGLPLWDLVVFLRSLAVWSTAGRGRGSRFAAARRHLVDGSAMTGELGARVASYRRRLGLPPALVEPLVTLGLVWLAARDAARLDPPAASRGQAVRLARLFLERGADCAILRAAAEGEAPEVGAG